VENRDGRWAYLPAGLSPIRVPRMKTASSSSFLPSFTATVCGDGEWGSWGWSVVSGDGGVGDLLGFALLLLPRMSASLALAPLVRSPLLPLQLQLRLWLLSLLLPPLVRVCSPCAHLDLWWVEVTKQRMYTQLAQPYLVVSHHDTIALPTGMGMGF
jgi:hypothetical protein